jgi:hypothetical protein
VLADRAAAQRCGRLLANMSEDAAAYKGLAAPRADLVALLEKAAE